MGWFLCLTPKMELINYAMLILNCRTRLSGPHSTADYTGWHSDLFI